MGVHPLQRLKVGHGRRIVKGRVQVHRRRQRISSGQHRDIARGGGDLRHVIVFLRFSGDLHQVARHDSGGIRAQVDKDAVGGGRVAVAALVLHEKAVLAIEGRVHYPPRCDYLALVGRGGPVALDRTDGQQAAQVEAHHHRVMVRGAVGRGGVQVLRLVLEVVVDDRWLVGVDGPDGGVGHLCSEAGRGQCVV